MMLHVDAPMTGTDAAILVAIVLFSSGHWVGGLAASVYCLIAGLRFE